VGNVKVAESFRNLLDADLAIIYKRRLSGERVAMGELIGDVKGKTVLMVDDMISTAGTVVEAAKLVMERGARDVMAACTHAVLVPPAFERILASPISKVVLTDTIPLGDRLAPIRSKVVELSVDQLLGNAIHRIHHNQSISALFERTAGTKR
jgi:ribose-phosphate pyrophosphokinase